MVAAVRRFAPRTPGRPGPRVTPDPGGGRSHIGDAALDWAIDHVRADAGAALHVVPAAADAPAVPAHLSPGYQDDLRKRLVDAGVPFTLHEPGTDPSHKVVRLVDELPAELAVVGLRKRSLAYKLVMGSHARHVIQHADCPVVTVKARHV